MKKFRSNSSGQLLIVAALAIAILIASTTLYVYELSKEQTGAGPPAMNDFILAVKQNTRKALISALANFSNGGENTVLTEDLSEFAQVLISLKVPGVYKLTYTVLNSSGYENGFRLSWNTNNIGSSSAYANFTLEAYEIPSNITLQYAVNITTTVTLQGSYTLTGTEKNVTLTCKVFNEEEPSLAKNITVYYEDAGSWIQANASNNLIITNYGNGTYTINFTVQTSSNVLQVSAHVYDLRGIFTRVNATCSSA
ncbi:hypothetical protein CW707_04425 [Candidatus Bathyarchaeota archaeon]|nr:MAG: hypothetical protein CW707_04425 [Candidatus Bathyarchaeota archaeon]